MLDTRDLRQNGRMNLTPVLDVVCLCAQWCGTCRSYATVFEQCAAAMPRHRFRWVDIEDEADLVGEPDIDTFPTLLVIRDGDALFAGPVLPRLSDIQRLVQSLEAPDAAADPAVPVELRELAQRLKSSVRSVR
jgi:thioredoxin 1